MGIYKKIVLGLITTVTAINLMACSGNNESEKVSDKETNYYSATIDGKKVYYSEEDEDVTSAKEFTEEFLSYAVKTDYRNKEYLKEYDLYTKEQRELDEMYNTKEDIEEIVTSWELVLELNSSDIKTIEFYKLKRQECATITLDYTSTIIEASDVYFEGSEKEVNVPNTRTMKLYITKEDNQWRASSYEVE